MEHYEGTSKPNLDSIPALIDRKSPETLESALERISDLRAMLRETHGAYVRSNMEVLKCKLIAGFLSCMVGAILIATILGAIFEI